MKPKYKILSLSVLAGIGYWIADAVCDFLFFYEEPLLDLLIFDVPAHEIYMRSVGFGLLFTFGIILSKIIIKRQRVENKLKESEKELHLLSSMVKQSNEGMALVDLNGNLQFLNDAFAAMHGYTSEELLGKHISIFHTQEQMPSVEAATRQTKETGSFGGEIWHVRRDGTIFPTLMHNSMLHDEVGNPTGMIGIAKDITERRHMAEDFRKSESKLAAILASFTEHMSMMDKDLNIIWANEVARNMFGDNIIGKKCYEVYHGRKEPCEPSPCLVLKAFMDGKTHEHETEVIDKDGKAVHFYCTANIAFKDKGGKPTAVIEVSKDITERKKFEAELKVKDQAIATSINGIGFADLEGKVTYVNSSYLKMYGYDNESEVLGKSVFEFAFGKKQPVKMLEALQKEGFAFKRGQVCKGINKGSGNRHNERLSPKGI